MKRFEKLVQPMLLVVIAATLVMVTPALAAVSCHKINANGVGQDNFDGTTDARIIGGGLLQGTTKGNFTVTGFDFPFVSIAGTVTFTTNKATLTVTGEGSVDVTTGEFIFEGPVTGATGKLAGATGDLLFEGVEDLSDGSFVEDVTGKICVDLKP